MSDHPGYAQLVRDGMKEHIREEIANRPDPAPMNSDHAPTAEEQLVTK